MKQYKYILLDWDGNLAKTLDLWLEAFRIILAEEGYHPSDEEIASSFGAVEDYFLSLGIKDPVAVYQRADDLGKKKLPEVELYPDALEVLIYLKEIHKSTALITASRHANIVHLLNRYNMHGLFDIIIAREDVTKHKPDPESLLVALDKLNGRREEAVMIGDSDKDVEAARNAGIDSILFYPPEHVKFYDIEKLKQFEPTYVVDDFSKIMDIVS